MKKLIFLSLLFSVLILSCNNKGPEPEPEFIRAYCYLYHFIPELEEVIWQVDGVEVPDGTAYALAFNGAILLEGTSEEIEFVVKAPGSGEVLASEVFLLERNKFYNIVIGGSNAEPTFLFSEVETSFPGSGNVKVQALHSIPGQGPIDLYMGDTTQNKRAVTALDFFEITDPFEVSDFDMRAFMAATAHSDAYEQDSVLLTSDFNEIVTGGNYFAVVAPFTSDTTSELTFWLYGLPLQ